MRHIGERESAFTRSTMTRAGVRVPTRSFPVCRYEAMSAQLAHISTRRSTSAKDLTKEGPAIAADLLTVWHRWRGSLDPERGALVDKDVNAGRTRRKKSRAKGRR